MGIDLYAGPLARCYMRDWQTPFTQFARRNNIAFETQYVQQPISLPAKKAASSVKAFRARMETKLGALADWSDADGPYEAYQLREGLEALVLAAAHRHRPDLTLPVDLPEDVQSHPAVSESSKKGYYIGPMAVFECHIIVPGSEPRICSDTDCVGAPAFVATTAALVESIEAMMDYLDLPNERLDAALEAGPPSVGGGVFNFEKQTIDPDTPASLRQHAAWGLACFGACLRFASRTGAAIIRDE